MKTIERIFYLAVGLCSIGLGGVYFLRRAGDLSQLTLFGGTISIILIAFGAAILLPAVRGQTAARGIFASYVIVILMFPIAEIALRIADIPKSFSYSEDVKERLKAQIDLRLEGVNAEPMVPFSLMLRESRKDKVPLFLTGYPNAATVYCREDEELTVYQADENGFRNPPELYTRQQTFDAVLMGDSFTHGACVDDGYTIADQLRRITGKSVYNLGYGGTGVAHNLGAYIEYANAKNPANAVLLLLEGSSISRLLNDEMPNPHARDYIEDQTAQGLTQQRAHKRNVLDSIVRLETLKLALKTIEGADMRDGTLQPGRNTWLRSVVEPIYRSRIFRLFFNIENTLLRNPRAGGKIPDCRRLNEAAPALKKTFDYLQSRSSAQGGSLYVGLIPAARYWTPDFPDCEYEMMKTLTTEAGGRFIDLVADISKLQNPNRLYAQRSRWSSNHFNRDGYRFVAERIAEALAAPK